MDSVAETLADARRAIDHVMGLPEDLSLLHSRRLSELLADMAEGALLVEEAAWSLERDGDARKAVVARLFVSRRLANEPVRGLMSSDRTMLDHFEALTRYGSIEANELVA